VLAATATAAAVAVVVVRRQLKLCQVSRVEQTGVRGVTHEIPIPLHLHICHAVAAAVCLVEDNDGLLQKCHTQLHGMQIHAVVAPALPGLAWTELLQDVQRTNCYKRGPRGLRVAKRHAVKVLVYKNWVLHQTRRRPGQDLDG